MELINNLISDHLMHAIGWTIVHSLWQAAFVALVMSIYLNRYQKERSVVRYRIALSSLYIMLGLSIITFCVHYFNPGVHGSQVVHSAGSIDITGISGSHYIQDLTFGLVHHFDFITTMWITGMVVFGIKLIGGYAVIKRYELSGQEINDSKVHVILNDLLDKMNLDKSVRVLESAKVYTPMMLGHIKPVILLPLGIINHLELNEVEAILAHELSHISRSDFLQNILQSFIEIMYYYHPAVWWISANVRAERENCCDEEAVRLCGSAMNYAKTLVKIEEMQSYRIPSLAIPMARNKNNLLNRVSRILHQPQNKSQIKEKLIATLMLFSVFTIFGESNASILNVANSSEEVTRYSSDNGHFDVTIVDTDHSNCSGKNQETELVKTIIIDSEDSHLVIDTIPQDDCNCNDISIDARTNERSFKLKIDDGVIKEFKINGEEVDDATKYFKLGENGKIIKTEDGQILLKEVDPTLRNNIGGKYKNYDFDEIEEDKVLKAPFKIGGQSETNNNEEALARMIEQITKSKHITKDQSDLIKSWSWSSEDEELEFESSIEELFESLGDEGILAFDDIDWPAIPQAPVWSHHEDGSLYLSIPQAPAAPKFPKNFMQGNRLEIPSPPSPPIPPTPPSIMSRNGFSFSSNNIFDALLSDGLIQPEEENTLELTDKYLKINGEKQPTNIWKKYRKIYESQLGHELMAGSKVKLKERTKAKSRFSIGFSRSES